MKKNEKQKQAQKLHHRAPAKPKGMVELTEKELEQVQGGARQEEIHQEGIPKVDPYSVAFRDEELPC